jgi:hypothetical protein
MILITGIVIKNLLLLMNVNKNHLNVVQNLYKLYLMVIGNLINV